MYALMTSPLNLELKLSKCKTETFYGSFGMEMLFATLYLVTTRVTL
jgi:hypothetical protein